jgi:hypothetical protein
MSGAALRRFVDRALEKHGRTLDAWFPGSFDWRALCADAPDMARRAAVGREEDGLEDDELEEAAEGTFRLAHVSALAALAVAAEGDADPYTLLERLTTPPRDEAEERFEALAERALGPVEESLGGVEVALDADGSRAEALAAAAWPAVEPVVAEHLESLERMGEDVPDAARGVLVGVARVATILAAFRWMAAASEDPAWPEEP